MRQEVLSQTVGLRVSLEVISLREEVYVFSWRAGGLCPTKRFNGENVTTCGSLLECFLCVC